MGRQAVQVLLEELVFRLGIGAIDIAGWSADLVGAEQKAARLFAHIIAGVAFAQHAHFRQTGGLARLDFRVSLGDDVLVLDGNDRHVQPDHGPGLAREIAAGGDHMLTGDVALAGVDHPFAVRLLRDAGDGGVAINGGAQLARALGQGLGQVGGLDIAVIGMLDGADQVIGLGERPDFLDLVRGQEVDVHADGLGHARIVAILVHPVLGQSKADVGHLGEADLELGLGFQRGVETDRIFVQLADRIGHVEQGQQARRVPGGAARQFLALDQHHIAPAHLGQMIEGRDADDPSADDDDACVSVHGTSLGRRPTF